MEKIKIKTGCYLLTPETTKFLGSSRNKITIVKNGKNKPYFENRELVLVHCSIANNDYHQESRPLHTFLPNKPFGCLLEIYPKNHTF